MFHADEDKTGLTKLIVAFSNFANASKRNCQCLYNLRIPNVRVVSCVELPGVDSPYTPSQALLTNLHPVTTSSAGRNFTVSETYLHALFPQLPRTRRYTDSSFPRPSVYVLRINCTLTQISTRQNADACRRRASRWSFVSSQNEFSCYDD
jgi:hypothetical protein